MSELLELQTNQPTLNFPVSVKSRVFGTSITNLPNQLFPESKKGNDNVIFNNTLKLPLPKFVNPEEKDCLMEYKEDIITNLYGREDRRYYGYMKIQLDVTERMREILLDWLVEVHWRFKLHPETLHLTANIIDKYLSKTVVLRNKLQLVGIAAMVIACKCEEVRPPELKDFVFITDSSFSGKEIIDMEYRLLKAVEFDLSGVTSYRFLQMIYNELGIEKVRVRLMAEYLIELCLLQYEMLKYKPSLITHAALSLAVRIVDRDKNWDKRNLKYKEQELKPLMKQMLILIQSTDNNELKAVKKKYSQQEFMCIAHISFKKSN